MTHPVIIKPAKSDGYCPDFVLRNERRIEKCNEQPCSESYNYVACASVRHLWFIMCSKNMQYFGAKCSNFLIVLL